jgi:hypothetical protein
MKFSALLALVLCISVVSASSWADERPMEFTPHNGFYGRSEGNGILRLFLGRPRPFHVESHGYDQADGTFRIDQTVTFQGQPSHERSWLLKTIRQNHYTATLSDAAGPVTGFTNGSRLLLEYRAKGPLIMHQTLELMPDGKTIDNVGRITLLGIPVGRLHETITRKD